MDPSLPPPDPATARWKSFFQKSAEPLFFLNRRQRLVDVNRAWEKLTGLSLAEVRGLSCRRRRAPASAEEPIDFLKAFLMPPPEALKGTPARVCRLGALPVARDQKSDPARGWYAIHFFSFGDDAGLLGILGKIRPLPAQGFFAGQPLPEKVIALRDQFTQEFAIDHLVVESPAMQRVAEQVRLAAQTGVPVTLLGEAGTGKHWLARCIHGQSEKHVHAFGRVDCSALPAAALAQVLFGDAGLGRQLRLGSLYLCRPECLPREMQDRLCQLLADWQDSPQAPRLLAGFDSDPEATVRAGRLLPELFCRISPLVINLPPVRERRPDLERLLDQFLKQAGRALERPGLSWSAEAVQVLQNYGWPGNLREVYRVAMQTAQRASGDSVAAADLPFHLRGSPLSQPRRLPLDSLLEQAEKRLIGLALKQAKNNKTEAAEILAVWRQRLLRRMQALGLEE